MGFDRDVALIGNGIAPLAAAYQLMSQGKSVLILNPDLDFFLEDSELSLDPLLHGKVNSQRIQSNQLDETLQVLKPIFPGSIEIWPTKRLKPSFHDPSAPHLRQRGRLWIASLKDQSETEWERLEDLYVETSDAGLNPQILEGLPAVRRFPGASTNTESFKGLYLPQLCDIDVQRYRNGLLEFIRERLDTEQVACAVNQIEIMPGGLRFLYQGRLSNAKIKEGVLIFWTPKMTSWILSQCKKREIKPQLPRGIRIWEQWSINSQESPNPNTVGIFENMAVWSDGEGSPQTYESQASSSGSHSPNRLAVLRAGPILSFQEFDTQLKGTGWVSREGLSSLSRLCHEFLRWDRFSIRSLKARAIFDWNQSQHWDLSGADPKVRIISHCDGPLTEILSATHQACEDLIGGVG